MFGKIKDIRKNVISFLCVISCLNQFIIREETKYILIYGYNAYACRKTYTFNDKRMVKDQT